MEKLSQSEYSKSRGILSGSSVGQHFRHIIEFYQCLVKGAKGNGKLCYEDRERNLFIENDIVFCKKTIVQLISDLAVLDPDQELELVSHLDGDPENLIFTKTNVQRELLYNLEHSIHHDALIKIGLKEVAEVNLADGYGVAPATIQYRKSCAQ